MVEFICVYIKRKKYNSVKKKKPKLTFNFLLKNKQFSNFSYAINISLETYLKYFVVNTSKICKKIE